MESIYRPLSATEGEKGVLMDKLEEKSEAQEQLLKQAYPGKSHERIWHPRKKN